jgi:hypothetical protein
MPQDLFTSGEVVPASGIYTVTHAEHRLPHLVTLLEGRHFPACSKCGEAVRFQLVRSASGLQDRREQILLYNLPELEPDAETESSSPEDGNLSTSDSADPTKQKRNQRAKAHRKGSKS